MNGYRLEVKTFKLVNVNYSIEWSRCHNSYFTHHRAIFSPSPKNGNRGRKSVKKITWVLRPGIEQGPWFTKWVSNNLPKRSGHVRIVNYVPIYIFTNPLRKHAYSNILKILQPKKGKFSNKKFWYFSYSCSKHRLWVLVRTASSRRF